MNVQEIYNKRIEEAAKKAKTDFLNRFNWSGNQETGFKKGAFWMLGNQWISVEEALPKTSNGFSKDVLCIDNRGCIIVAKYQDGVGWWSRGGTHWNTNSFTHWMPTPTLKGCE